MSQQQLIPQTPQAVTIDALDSEERIAAISRSLSAVGELSKIAPAIAASLREEFVTLAEAMTVSTDADYQESATIVQQATGAAKRLEEARKRYKEPVLEAGRQIDSIFRTMAEPLGEANGTIRSKIAAYRAAQERLRRAEEERLRKIAEAEARRQREKELREAKKAGADQEELEAIKAAPPPPVPVVAPPPPAQVKGISSRTTWRGRITDKRKFVKACLEGAGGASIELLSVDQLALNALARGLKQGLAIPGAEAYCEDSLAVRGR